MKPIEVPLEGQRIWKCRNCNTEQTSGIQCRKCGAASEAFEEKKGVIDTSEKGVYETKANILIQGFPVDKGVLVILPVNFYITKDLEERKLIVKTSKKVSKAKAVRTLKRRVGNFENPYKKIGTRDPITQQATEIP